MYNDSLPPPAIKPPINLPVGRNLRRLALSIAGAVPGVGSIIADAADEILPDPETEDRKRWEFEITSTLNWMRSYFTISGIPISQAAWQIADVAWNVDVEAKGDTAIDESVILLQWPELSNAELDEGLAELENSDWISCWRDPNSRSGCGGFHTKSLLFAFVDPVKGITSPVDDAKAIAAFALSREDNVSSEEVDAQFGWDNRRLYPALWLLSEQIVPDACDNHCVENYPFSWLYLFGETRRKLRAFSQI